jgi:DNA-binding transcriptional regulator YiaG
MFALEMFGLPVRPNYFRLERLAAGSAIICEKRAPALTSVMTRTHFHAMITTLKSPSGTKIRSAREELNLSQEAFARFVGVSVRTIARWESGFSKPSKLARQKLECAYSVEEKD